MDADDASSAEMRRLPTNRDADPLALDEDTVEQLLTGALRPGQAPAGYAEAAQLLAAAAAAPTPGELAGQEAALAELRAVARARPAAATGPASPRRRRRRTGLAVVVVVGALVTGGAAGAATGHLPGPGAGGGPKHPGQPAALTRRRPPTEEGQPTGAGHATQPAPVAAYPTRGPAAPPASGPGCRRLPASPNLEGLCQAFLVRQRAASRAGSWTRPPWRPWPVRPAARARSRPIARPSSPGSRRPRNSSSQRLRTTKERARAARRPAPAAAARARAARRRPHRRHRRTADAAASRQRRNRHQSPVVTRTVPLALLLPEQLSRRSSGPRGGSRCWQFLGASRCWSPSRWACW